MLQAFPHYQWLRGRDEAPLGQSIGKKLVVDDATDFVAYQCAPENKLCLHSFELGLDKDAEVPPYQRQHGTNKCQSSRWHLVRPWETSLRNEFRPVCLGEDRHGCLCRAVADRDCAYNLLRAESLNDVLNYCLTVVVKCLAGTQTLDVFKVLGGGRGDDVVTGSRGEL